MRPYIANSDTVAALRGRASSCSGIAPALRGGAMSMLLLLSLLGALAAGCGSDDDASPDDATADGGGAGRGEVDAGADPETDAAAPVADGGGAGSGPWQSTRGMCDLDSGYL